MAKEKILLLLLIIMLINPFYYGYRVAILFVLVLFFQLERTVKLLDKNVLYLFVFGALYHFIAASRTDAVNTSILSFLPDVFLPAVIYLIGKGVSTKYQMAEIRIFFLFFILLFFSIIPIISMLEQIINDGFVGVRALYLIWDKTAMISATGLGAYFSINMAAIALLNAPKSTQLQKRISFFVIILFVLSIICVLRLGNRTQLVIAGAAIVLSYILNFRKMSNLSRIFQFIIFGVVIGYVLYLFASQSEFIHFYEDRMDNAEFGVAGAGGRSERWQLALESIVTDPWGWELSRFGYAHNLWLDVARVSGIFALLPLVLFSVASFKLFLKSLKKVRHEKYLTTFIFVFFVSIGLEFFVEPIMEGMYLLFFVFCLFVGFLAGINTQVGRVKLIKR
jgi:O-antigen ligase